MKKLLEEHHRKNGYSAISYTNPNGVTVRTNLLDREGNIIGNCSKEGTVMYGEMSSEEIFTSESGNSSFTREKCEMKN